MLRIKNFDQAMIGGFLILVAFLALYLSWPLSSGSDVGLGPGFVPRTFAVIQLGLGAVMFFNACREAGDKPEPWQLRPLVLVLLSVAFFAATIERLGLVIALSGLVLIGCSAHRKTTFKEALALTVGSVVFSVLVFVKALGLAILLWPAFL